MSKKEKKCSSLRVCGCWMMDTVDGNGSGGGGWKEIIITCLLYGERAEYV